MNKQHSAQREVSRRIFLKHTAAAAASLGSLTAGIQPVMAAGSDRIRVGLIGCGNRGTGAAMNCVLSSPGVELVALGDMFQDKIDKALVALKDTSGKKEWSCSTPWTRADAIKVTPDTCFTGFDAYQKVIASGVDLVILATPPAFRPLHLKAAVAAGKHAFIEKPVAVDPAGARSIMASADVAKEKGLAIVAGTQRRHQARYIEMMKRVQQGDIGTLQGGECYWVGCCVRRWGFFAPRQPQWSDLEWQLRNWYFFTWLSGDHVVEQHVHNIDVLNWALGAHPTDALGMGGRQWRTQPEFGNIWDHFAVRYRYPNGATVLSMCRQNDNCYETVTETITGTKGKAFAGRIEGAQPWKFAGDERSAYEQEHADLIASIRAGRPLNEGRQVAESTLAAIMGRMSAYTGQIVQWDWVLNKSQLDLWPKEDLKLGPYPVPPVAVPGVTQLL
jgi:predicted dehydrogenase